MNIFVILFTLLCYNVRSLPATCLTESPYGFFTVRILSYLLLFTLCFLFNNDFFGSNILEGVDLLVIGEDERFFRMLNVQAPPATCLTESRYGFLGLEF